MRVQDMDVFLRHARFRRARTVILRAIAIAVEEIRTCRRLFAAAPMLNLRKPAQLAHATEHGKPPAVDAQALEHIQRRLNRIRAGIVACVDDGEAVFIGDCLVQVVERGKARRNLPM